MNISGPWFERSASIMDSTRLVPEAQALLTPNVRRRKEQTTLFHGFRVRCTLTSAEEGTMQDSEDFTPHTKPPPAVPAPPSDETPLFPCPRVANRTMSASRPTRNAVGAGGGGGGDGAESAGLSEAVAPILEKPVFTGQEPRQQIDRSGIIGQSLFNTKKQHRHLSHKLEISQTEVTPHPHPLLHSHSYILSQTSSNTRTLAASSPHGFVAHSPHLDPCPTA